MLFSEVYGAYYDCVGAIISEAQRGVLTASRMQQIVRQRAFPESLLTIPQALRNGAWPLLREDGTTVIRHPVAAPVTELEKRWLKSLLTDPRIRLFDIDEGELADVEPLFTQEQLVYYDRFTDGDPWEDEGYRGRFRQIVDAIRTNTGLTVAYRNYRGKQSEQHIWPQYLEYSQQDDKLRLFGYSPAERCGITLNLGRMSACAPAERFDPAIFGEFRREQRQAVIELTDFRNALERALLQFSNLAKKTVQLDPSHYHITLSYHAEDETELLIQLLSFGPVLKVLEPPELVERVRERIMRQFRLDQKK